MTIEPFELAAYQEYRRAFRRLQDVENQCSHVRYYCTSAERGIVKEALEKLVKDAQNDAGAALNRLREIILEAKT